MSLWRIILDCEILEAIVENAGWAAEDTQLRTPCWHARQLRFDEFRMVEIEVDIAAGPYQFMRVQIALLRDHSREQRRFEHVEGEAEAEVARTLKEQARQAAVRSEERRVGKACVSTCRSRGARSI